jgi:predicted peroxiredoxin
MTSRSRYHWFSGLALASLVLACAPAAPPAAPPSTAVTSPAAAPTKPALLINITSGKENLHAVSMALKLAQSALADGREVVVFLNVGATVFASTALGEDVRFADFPPVLQLMREIIAAGGKVIVCAHCASVSGVSEASLLPGTAVSHHGEILQALKPDMVGFSY